MSDARGNEDCISWPATIITIKSVPFCQESAIKSPSNPSLSSNGHDHARSAWMSHKQDHVLYSTRHPVHAMLLQVSKNTSTAQKPLYPTEIIHLVLLKKKTYKHLTSYYQETQKTPNLPAFSNTNHTLETVSSENCTLLLPLHLQGLQRWWNQTLSQVPHAATFVNPMPISAISYRLVQHWTGLYYTQPKIISLFALWLRTSFF